MILPRKFLLFVLLLLLTVTLSACSSEKPSNTPDYTETGKQGVFHFIVVDEAVTANREALQSIADWVCKLQDICAIIFWDDVGKAATEIPMTDEQTEAIMARYNKNKGNDVDRVSTCADEGVCK